MRSNEHEDGNGCMWTAQSRAIATGSSRQKQRELEAGKAVAGSRPKNAIARRSIRGRRPRWGLDIRFVVTNLGGGSAEHVYDVIYCARGQAENLIKMHKGQLASDRTSCRSPIANQVRLVLHTAAYWLMLTIRAAMPKTHQLISAKPNSPRYGYGSSSLGPASSKPSRAYAWPSPRPA
jgi:hypothetical protein